MGHRNQDSVNRLGEEGGSSFSTTKIFEGFSNDVLSDLMGQWEEFYQRGEEPPPEWPVSADPALRETLRLRIEDQKRLYVLMEFAQPPRDEGKEADEQLPSYPDHEILMETGRGGMGVVYKARDLKLGRIVAIKTIAEGRHASSDELDRFRAEAHAIARLRHPNIIAIHAIGEHDNRPFLSLEFAEGGSLAQRLAEKPMAPREAARLVETLAQAVHAAHQAGVVHRDLKPSNVLLTADGIPKVSDFGLAKLLDSDSGGTVSGQILGSPSYMPPEQAEGHSKQVGPAADIYALGAILYQALTGRPPFLGESKLETLRLVTTTEVVSPRRLRPDVPRDLETICLKCLEKGPLRRHASAKALAEDLRRFIEDRPISARPVGSVGRLWRWSRRKPKVAGLVAALFLTFALGTPALLGLWLRARTDRARAESEAEISKAVNEFLQKDMLAQASAYSQFKLDVKPDPDLKVRTVLDRAAENIGERFSGQPLVEASIRQTIGGAYLELGLYPQALPHLKRALDLCRLAGGDQAPDTLVAMRSLGSLHLADSKFAEARLLLIPALEGLRQVRGLEHPDTLIAMDSLAQLYLNQGVNLPEAESLTSHVREVLLRARGPTDLKTLDATNSLAMVLQTRGKSEQAEGLLKNVVEELQKQMTVDHPSTLLAMHNLAHVYYALGKKIDAERLFNEVLGRQRRLLGDRHPHTLLSMVWLAFLYLEQDELDKSEPLFIEAVNGCRAALDRNHEIAEGALAGLAGIYYRKGDRKRLGPVLIEARDITSARYGPDEKITANGNQSVGLFFLAQGEYGKAEPYFRDCLNYWEKHDLGDWNRFANELRYGISLLAQKKLPEAKFHLLVGYNGVRPDREHIPPLEEVDLGWLIEQVGSLRNANGDPWRNVSTLSVFYKDPNVRAIILDLQFPDDAFAPP